MWGTASTSKPSSMTSGTACSSAIPCWTEPRRSGRSSSRGRFSGKGDSMGSSSFPSAPSTSPRPCCCPSPGGGCQHGSDLVRLLPRKAIGGSGHRFLPIGPCHRRTPSGTVHAEPPDLDLLHVHMPGTRLDEFPLVVTVGLAQIPILEPVERSIREVRRARVDFDRRSFCKTEGVLAGIAALLRLYRLRRAHRGSRKRAFLDGIVENQPGHGLRPGRGESALRQVQQGGRRRVAGLFAARVEIAEQRPRLFPSGKADFFTAKDREVLADLKVTEIQEEPIQTKFGPRTLHTRKVGIADREGKPRFWWGFRWTSPSATWLESLRDRRRIQPRNAPPPANPWTRSSPIVVCDARGRAPTRSAPVPGIG